MIKDKINDVLYLILCSLAFGVVCVSVLVLVSFIDDIGNKKYQNTPKEGMLRIIYPNGSIADWPKDKVKVGRY